MVEILDLPHLVCIICISLFCLYAYSFPPANVGEVFGYDVLRALNNPLVFRGAKKHFGQQLLNHLHTLD